MQPALPGRPAGEPSTDGPWLSADEVGRFEQGSGFSRWALARYLVGRSIAESVSRTLLLAALAVLALGAVAEWVLHSLLLAIFAVVVAGVVLLLRAALRAVLVRLTAADRYGPVEARLRALVADTHRDVLRELRRLGLPSHTLTLPLLVRRMVGARRVETFERLRGFDIERAVPRGRLDEVHTLLRGATGAAGAPGATGAAGAPGAAGSAGAGNPIA